MANPYLALAVALSAALDGISHGIEPPDPLDESFSSYDDAGLERIGVQRLPGTLGEALESFAQDQVVQESTGFLYLRPAPDRQTSRWKLRAVVGPWEHRRYGDA